MVESQTPKPGALLIDMTRMNEGVTIDAETITITASLR